MKPLVLLFAVLASVQAKGLWSSTPAVFKNVIQQAFPFGNGKLGGIMNIHLEILFNTDEISYVIWISRSRKSSH
jgi:hypothetical protein